MTERRLKKRGCQWKGCGTKVVFKWCEKHRTLAQRIQSDEAQRRRRYRNRRERPARRCKRCREPMPGVTAQADYCRRCRAYRYMGYQLTAAQRKAEQIGEHGIAADIQDIKERLEI